MTEDGWPPVDAPLDISLDGWVVVSFSFCLGSRAGIICVLPHVARFLDKKLGRVIARPLWRPKADLIGGFGGAIALPVCDAGQTATSRLEPQLN